MKHYFIINPAAGNGKVQAALLPRILDGAKKWGADYEVHRTSGPDEATLYVRGRIAAGNGERLRFYSCGGDGTAAEILNGLYGAENAELAIVPAGSGNDYIRNFGTPEQFRDIAAQIAGEAVPVDVIRYTYIPVHQKTGKVGGEISSYAINMVNMGFDAKAAAHMKRLKNKFFIKGTGAYIAGVVRELLQYKMTRAVIRPKGEEAFESEFLLGGVGSGRYSGGGFDGIPLALVNDGLLDMILIKPITRGKFLSLVGIYHDGKHLSHRDLASLTWLSRLEEVVIEPKNGLLFTTDGEAHYTESPLTVSLAPEKVRFVIPDGVTPP